MEHFDYVYASAGGATAAVRPYCLVGVVASGNLEVLMEARPAGGECRFAVETAADGYGASWQAVIADFMDRHRPAGLLVSIHDNAASPAVVSLRLDQAYEQLTGK